MSCFLLNTQIYLQRALFCLVSVNENFFGVCIHAVQQNWWLNVNTKSWAQPPIPKIVTNFLVTHTNKRIKKQTFKQCRSVFTHLLWQFCVRSKSCKLRQIRIVYESAFEFHLHSLIAIFNFFFTAEIRNATQQCSMARVLAEELKAFPVECLNFHFYCEAQFWAPDVCEAFNL